MTDSVETTYRGVPLTLERPMGAAPKAVMAAEFVERADVLLDQQGAKMSSAMIAAMAERRNREASFLRQLSEANDAPHRAVGR